MQADSIASLHDVYKQKTLLSLGVNWRRQGDYLRSIQFLNEAHKITDSLKLPKTFADINREKGETFRASKRYEDSFDYLYRALSYYKRSGDVEGLAETYDRLAATSYEVAFFNLEATNPMYLLTNAPVSQNEIKDEFKGISKYADSLSFYMARSNWYADQIGRIDLNLSTAIIAASTLVNQKQYDKASKLFDETIAKMKAHKIRSELGLIYLNKAFMFQGDHLNIPDSVIHYVNMAMPYIDESGVRIYKSMAFGSLKGAFKEIGAYKKAMIYNDSLYFIEEDLQVESVKLRLLTEMLSNNIEAERQSSAHSQRLSLIIISGFIVFLLVTLVFVSITWSRSKRQQNLLRELKKKNDIISNQNSELNRINSEKDRFFSIIAHDLRSPFASILGLTDLLITSIDSNETEEAHMYGTLIKQSSKKSMELINNLRTWARNQTGTLAFNPKEISLRALLEDAVDFNSESALKKQIKLSLTSSKDIKLVADYDMLNTVFRNLVSNAVKFTYPGGRVSVESNKHNDTVVIKIVDNGIGIPTDMVGKLFELDKPIGRQGTEGESSTGLGLILCKDFVDRHSGQIMVDSVEDKGTTISVILPTGYEVVIPNQNQVPYVVRNYKPTKKRARKPWFYPGTLPT
ncbi:MAG: tetratricopeptide repeat-containing sensor histidine kinase [Cryomorphaceae bacterium]|nr:tetratricopeptide repeat-containing sensor histidine kinase [Cryomorphaceae bacterium]